MARYSSAPPPNTADRKALQERAREASRPVAPEERVSWPFSNQKNLFSREETALGGADKVDKTALSGD